jgi:hypothetical protein
MQISILNKDHAMKARWRCKSKAESIPTLALDEGD